MSIVAAVLAVVVVVFAETSIVQVGDGRTRWRDRLGRRVDLAFDDVADVRKHPTRKRVQLVTTDGQVLRLPVQPQKSPEVRWLVFGDRPTTSPPVHD